MPQSKRPKRPRLPLPGSTKKKADKPKTDDELAYDELKKKLGNTKLMAAKDGELDTLTNDLSRALAPTPDTWVTRWGGKGLGHNVFDLRAMLDISEPFGNTVRWYARSLFPGGDEIGFPGTRLAGAGSLVLVLGPGLTEMSREAGDESFYPTVEGGRLLTQTMAASNDADELTRIMSSLSRNATKAYVRTLEVMVKRELSVTTFVAPDGVPRRADLVLEQARDDLAWLTRPVGTTTGSSLMNGVFRAIDDRNDGRFVFAPEGERGKSPPDEISGTIAAHLRGRAFRTRTRMKVTIQVTKATESWLPGAPRTRRTLVEAERASK